MWHILKISFCGMGIAVFCFNLKVVNENYSDLVPYKSRENNLI